MKSLFLLGSLFLAPMQCPTAAESGDGLKAASTYKQLWDGSDGCQIRKALQDDNFKKVFFCFCFCFANRFGQTKQRRTVCTISSSVFRGSLLKMIGHAVCSAKGRSSKAGGPKRGEREADIADLVAKLGPCCDRDRGASCLSCYSCIFTAPPLAPSFPGAPVQPIKWQQNPSRIRPSVLATALVFNTKSSHSAWTVP